MANEVSMPYYCIIRMCLHGFVGRGGQNGENRDLLSKVILLHELELYSF